jgi:hypothetical protein
MATKLQEFRTNYPQYDDMSDQALADALHSKFYSDVPKSEFYDKLGLTYGLAENVGRALIGTPGRLYQSALGNAQAEVERENLDNIDNFQKRFEEGKDAYPNLLERATDPRAIMDLLAKGYGGLNQQRAQYQKLADFAKSRGVEPTQDAVNAFMKDPKNQQDLIRYMGEDAAKDSLRFQLKQIEAQKLVPETRYAEDDWVNKYGTMITQSIADMAPTLAVGYLTGRGVPAPAAALSTMFSQTAGTTYTDLRKTDPAIYDTFLTKSGLKGTGVDPETASRVAGVYALAETIPEAIPLGKLLGEGAKPFIKRAIELMLFEPGSEVSTELMQIAADNLMLNENMTKEEILGRIRDAAIGGVGVAGFMAATGAVADRITYGPDGGKIEAAKPSGPTVSTDFETLLEDGFDTPPAAVTLSDADKAKAAPLLALPPPSKDEPFLSRRYPPAKDVAEPEFDNQAMGAAVRDAQDKLNRQNLQDRTSLLARSAQEQLRPISVTADDAAGGALAEVLSKPLGDIRAKRIRLGQNPDAPVTLKDLQEAKVPSTVIEQVKAAKQPATTALKQMDAEGRGISELDLGTSPTAQLSDAPFNDEQYKSAVMMLNEKGRYSFEGLKQATGLTSTSKLAKLKQALIDRGHLVEGKNGPVPSNQMRNERATVPQDLPEGHVIANVVRELPVGAVRVRQTKDGKTTSLGVFNTQADAQAKISSVRSNEDTKGGARSQLRIEPAGKTAFGVVQKRFDKDGNFIGEAVVDSFATEAEARRAYDQNMQRPVTPEPSAKTEEAASVPQPQHRIEPRKVVKQHKLLVNGNVRGVYDNTPEGVQQMTADANALPKDAKLSIEDVSADAYALIRDKLDASGNVVGTQEMGVTPDIKAAQAEAARLNKLGQVRNVAPKALEGRIDEITAALERVAEKSGLPLLGTKVRLVNRVTAPDGSVVEGSFNNGIIKLTVDHFTPDMSTEEITAALAAVMRHEFVHQLRLSGLLAPETPAWVALSSYIRKKVDPKGQNNETYLARAERMYSGMPGYTTADAIQEEAIAEAFRSWADRSDPATGKPASAFRQIVQWFRKLLMELPKDIFTQMDSGEFVRSKVKSPGANNLRNKDRQRIETAQKQLKQAKANADENAARAATAEYLSAREQAREDSAGRSGFKTVIGTDPSRTYAEGNLMPLEQAAAMVQAFKDTAGISTDGLTLTLQPNIEFMQKIAKAQENAKHDPGNVAVKRAYTAFNTETKAMFNSMGITIEPWRGMGQPYASPAEMAADMATNKRVKMRLTSEMFAPTPSIADHPMHQNSGIKATDGTALTYNDLFRVAHDVFGYSQIGLRSGYDGEFTAYHEHARLYSEEARRALATETLAQSAWHNFGPHLWRNDGQVATVNDVDYLPSEKKEFAKQKAFLLDAPLVASDPAFEQIENSKTLDMEFASEDDAKFSLAPVNVRRAMKGQAVGLKNVTKTASLAKSFADTSKKRYPTGRDLKLAIQTRVSDAAEKAGIDLRQQDEQVLYHLVKQGVTDALYALKSNANAIGWYNRTVSEALEIMSLLHPEIKTDPNARLAFRAALAITSNGLKVDKNFELAETAYSAWKTTGKLPTNLGVGTAKAAINKSMRLFNSMVETYGYDKVDQFMASPFTVGQLKRAGFKISGEGVDVIVRGAAVLGPKIGNGFFSNLNGKFDALTIDRWLMRTWGRWTGLLVDVNQAKIDRALNEMTNVIDRLRQDQAAFNAFEEATGVSLNGAPAEVAVALNKASTDPDVRARMNGIGAETVFEDEEAPLGDILRRRANAAWKYIDGQIEQPSQSQRPFIRLVMDGVLKIMHRSGYPDLTMSDLQALLWYPEKRLYDSAKGRTEEEGYEDDEAPDYANAAAKLVSSKGVSAEAVSQAKNQGRQNAEAADRALRDQAAERAGSLQSNLGGDARYAPASLDEAIGRLNGSQRRARADFLKRSIFVADRISRERDGRVRVYRGTSATGTGSLRGVATVFKPERGFKTTLAAAELPAPVIHELHKTPENAVAFRDLLRRSAEKSPFGAAVFLYPAEEYQNFRLFLTEDRTGGFAIKPDGDIVSVFSAGGGQVQPMLSLATEEGGTKLDCFNTVLPKIYGLNGFVETGRDPWNDQYKPTIANGAAKDWDYETFKLYNNGRPDIVYMEYRPAARNALTGEEARMATRLSAAPVPLTEEQLRVAARLPGGALYGRNDLAPATVLSPSNTPQIDTNGERDGNKFFGGDVADEQLRMARDGDRGTVLTYMTPEEFLALSGSVPKTEAQDVFNAAPDAGYKFNTLPSVIFTGDRDHVQVKQTDGAYAAQALIGKADSIPVMVLPERGREFGLITGLKKGNTVVPFTQGFPFEYYPERRGERMSVGSEKFQKFFGDSKVVDATGKPLVVYTGTEGADYTVFNIPSYFSENPNEASAYSFWSDIPRREKMLSGTPRERRGNDALVGTRVPFYGIVSDAREDGQTGVVATDNGVVDLSGGKVVYLTDLAVKPDSYDGGAVQLVRGDTRKAYREVLINTREYADRRFPARQQARVYPVYLSIQNPIKMDPLKANQYAKRLGMEPERAQEIFADLIAQGYDGIETVSDEASLNPDMAVALGGVPRHFIPFYPTQIKSAIGNNGNWDAANPDIRYSVDTVGLKVNTEPTSPTWVIEQKTPGYVSRMAEQIGRSKTKFLGTSVFEQRVIWQDRYLSLEEITDALRKNHGLVNDMNDVHQIQQLSDGRAFYRIQDAEAELYTPMFEAIHEAHKNGVTFDDVEMFLLAKHAPERNAYLRAKKSPSANPSGLSDADAFAFIDKMRAEGKYAELEAIAQMAYRITADTTKVRLEGGLISPEQAAASPFRFYVPLKGLDPTNLDPDDNDTRNQMRIGRGYNVGGRESRRPVGRKSIASDIVGHLIAQNTEAILRSEKNRVAVSLAQLIRDNPGNAFGRILPQVPSKLVTSTNGMIRSMPDMNYRSRPDIVTAKVAGKEVVMEITDKWLARAMRNDNVPRNGKIVQVLSTLNRYFATVNTAWNPEFMITNLFRDAQTAAILGKQYDIESFSKKLLLDTPKAIAAVRQVLRTGRIEGEMAEWYDEMRRSGGTTESLGLLTVEQQVARLRGALADTKLGNTRHAVVRVAKGTAQLIEDYNKVAENALRLAAYANARRAGATAEQASYIAKNLTVNFGKGGEKKVIANALYLFYNASLSGSFVLLKGLKNPRVQKMAMGLVVVGAMQSLIGRLLSGDDDEDGISDYDEVPDYVLKNNMVIMTGGKKYIAIPMPYGFNFFHNVGRNLMDAFSGAPNKSIGKSIMDTVEVAFDSFNPLGGTGSLLNVMAPTLLDPVVDLVSNRDYRGAAIVPDRPSFDGLPVPNSQKFWASTGQPYKDAAAFFNSISGGNETLPGWWDWSPEVMNYVTDFVLGAAGGFAQRNFALYDQLAKGTFTMDDSADLLPFARKVLGTVGNRADTDRFYTQSEKVLLHDKQIRTAAKAGEVGLANERARTSPELTRLIPVFKAIDKQLADLRKARKAVEKSKIDEGAKRDRVKALREAENALMKKASIMYLEITGRAD